MSSSVPEFVRTTGYSLTWPAVREIFSSWSSSFTPRWPTGARSSGLGSGFFSVPLDRSSSSPMVSPGPSDHAEEAREERAAVPHDVVNHEAERSHGEQAQARD